MLQCTFLQSWKKIFILVANFINSGKRVKRHDFSRIVSNCKCALFQKTTFTCGFLRQATAGDSIRLWVFDSGGNNKVTFLLSTSMMLLNLALVKRSQFSPGDSIRDLRLECGIRVCGAVPGLRAGNPQHRQLGLLSHPTPRIQPLHTNYRKLRPL